MLAQLSWVLLLTAVTVTFHGLYSVLLIGEMRAISRHAARRHLFMQGHIPFLIEVVMLLLLIHCADAVVWALFYDWKSGVADFETALYFSLSSYTTIGYGDVILPPHLRLVGVMEGLVGTFMCGWSVALLVALLQSLLKAEAIRTVLPEEERHPR